MVERLGGGDLAGPPVDLEQAVRVAADDGVEEFAARQVSVVRRHLADDAAGRLVLGDPEPALLEGRGVVDRGHMHGDAGGVEAALAVAHRVAEAGLPMEIGVGREGDRAVGGQRHRAVPGVLDAGHPQPVAIDVVIVGGQPALVEDGWGVLVGVDIVAGGHGSVVDRGHLDPHRGGVEAAMAVADRIGERGFAVEIGVGGEDDMVPGQLDRAVLRLLHRDDAQRVAVGVMVVAGEEAAGHADRGILGGGQPVVGGDGRIVDRRHLDPGHGGVEPALAVADGIGERGLAVEIGVGGEADAAVRIQHDLPMAGALDADDMQKVAVAVAIVAEQRRRLDPQRPVLVGASADRRPPPARR